MSLTIRPASLPDAETIALFNTAMARETEHLELDPARLLAGVRAVLSDPAKGFYLLAHSGPRVAGQMMITFEWSDWRNGVFWWIQSVYVPPEFRHQGVFTALYRHVEARAKTSGAVCGLRLYVERHNATAQRAYQHLGMTKTVYNLYEVDFILTRP